MVNLTGVGQVYYQQCKELVTGLQQANESLSSQHATRSGTLRVSAAGAFAEEYVAPALMKYKSFALLGMLYSGSKIVGSFGHCHPHCLSEQRR